MARAVLIPVDSGRYNLLGIARMLNGRTQRWFMGHANKHNTSGAPDWVNLQAFPAVAGTIYSLTAHGSGAPYGPPNDDGGTWSVRKRIDDWCQGWDDDDTENAVAPADTDKWLVVDVAAADLVSAESGGTSLFRFGTVVYENASLASAIAYIAANY